MILRVTLAIAAICGLAACASSVSTAPDDATIKLFEFVAFTHEPFVKAEHKFDSFCGKMTDALRQVRDDPGAVVDTSILRASLDSAKAANQTSREAFAGQDSATGDLLALKNRSLYCSAISDSLYNQIPKTLDILGSGSADRWNQAKGLLGAEMLGKVIHSYKDCDAGFLSLKDKYHYIEMDSVSTTNP